MQAEDFKYLLIAGQDQIHALLQAKSAAVQAQVVVIGHAPGAPGVMLIIDLTAAIFFQVSLPK